jgi:ABC-type nitrate/sulfonate/bicarbonate transport system substrate-binding protein
MDVPGKPWARMMARAAVLGLALVLAAPAGEPAAQTVPILGYVANADADPKRLAALKKGLADLGYVEGETLKAEYRYA